MRPDVTHIITFIKVVETGSFTRAAEELLLSKSVVSKHISALEYALKSQLIKRSTRKLEITDIGQDYYQHLKNIPNQLQCAQDLIHHHASDAQGRLKVIAPSNFETSLKNDVIPKFLAKNPHVLLQLEFVQQPDELISSDFDIIIMWKLNTQTFPDYPLISKKLFSMPVGLYASRNYLNKHGTPKTPAELKHHNCFSSINQKWPFILKDGSIIHINITGNLVTKSQEIIHQATVNGLGIAYSYPFVFEESLNNKSVVKVLEQYTQHCVDVHLFYHPTQYMPKKITAFTQLIQSHYHQKQKEILARGS